MSRRFKLVFLAENEEYIKDVGCTVDGRLTASNSLAVESLPAVVSKFFKSGGFRGRLRIGSASLFADLDMIVCNRIIHDSILTE